MAGEDSPLSDVTEVWDLEVIVVIEAALVVLETVVSFALGGAVVFPLCVVSGGVADDWDDDGDSEDEDDVE